MPEDIAKMREEITGIIDRVFPLQRRRSLCEDYDSEFYEQLQDCYQHLSKARNCLCVIEVYPEKEMGTIVCARSTNAKTEFMREKEPVNYADSNTNTQRSQGQVS